MTVMKWVTSGESMVLVRERVMAADMPSVRGLPAHCSRSRSRRASSRAKGKGAGNEGCREGNDPCG